MTQTDDPPVPRAALKAQLRAQARAARLGVTHGAAAARALVRHFGASPWGDVKPGTVVAGYWPIHGEIDCRPLLRRLKKERGAVIALPAVEARGGPLAFRLWDGAVPAARDALNMAAPGADAGHARPQLLFAPLLLVDRAGHRLGYGGGYYDRTLKALRREGGVTALGLAFDMQLTEKLPANADDMTLDGVITETGWRRFGGEGDAAPAGEAAPDPS